MIPINNDQANYILNHPISCSARPIVRTHDAVKIMHDEFRAQGWDVRVNTGGANWLFYGPRNERRFRLTRKLYLEGWTEYYGAKRWFTVRSYKLKKDYNPKIIARMIARMLGAYEPTPIQSDACPADNGVVQEGI